MFGKDTQEQNKLSFAAIELEQKLKTSDVDLVSERVGGETLSCSDDFTNGQQEDKWQSVIARTAHLRLSIFLDGGISCLRAYGNKG